ncbi:hypothetical protein LINGRAHAP2_LOCUS458 [Linum grandiflorum]
MYDRLRAMWRPEGRMRMVDLDNEIFLVHFDNPQDYDHALTGGPWMILDHYLVCHGWDPSFRASSDLPPKMVIWVRFPKLPYQYYHTDILTGLGNLIGRTVRLDRRTLTSARGKFARLAVEINLKDAVATGVFLDDVWQDVEYENLPSLCFTCGRVGHENDSCPMNVQATTTLSGPDAAVPRESGRRPNPVATGSTGQPEFGSWLTVQRKFWKPKIKEHPQINSSITATNLIKKGKDRGINGKRKESDKPSSSIKAQSQPLATTAGMMTTKGQNSRMVIKGKGGIHSGSTSGGDEINPRSGQAQIILKPISTSTVGPTHKLVISTPTVNEDVALVGMDNNCTSMQKATFHAASKSVSSHRQSLTHPISTSLAKSVQALPDMTKPTTDLPSGLSIESPAISQETSLPGNLILESSTAFILSPNTMETDIPPCTTNNPTFTPELSSDDPCEPLATKSLTRLPTPNTTLPPPLFGNQSLACNSTEECVIDKSRSAASISILQRVKSRGTMVANSTQVSTNMRGVEQAGNKPETKLDKKKKAKKIAQILPLEGIQIGIANTRAGSYTSAAKKQANPVDSARVSQSDFDLNRPNVDCNVTNRVQINSDVSISEGDSIDEH